MNNNIIKLYNKAKVLNILNREEEYHFCSVPINPSSLAIFIDDDHSLCEIPPYIKFENIVIFKGRDVNKIDFNSNPYVNYIDLSNIESTESIDLSNAFEACTNLQYINLGALKIYDLYRAFFNCSNIIEIDFSTSLFDDFVSFNQTFANCNCLKTVRFNGNKLTNITSLENTFTNCFELQTLDLSSFLTFYTSSFYNCFYNCRNLRELNISNFHTMDKARFASSFFHCNNLEIVYAPLKYINKSFFENLKNVNIIDTGVYDNDTWRSLCEVPE